MKDFQNYSNETFDILPELIIGCNFDNCVFNAETKIERSNLKNCTFNESIHFYLSNVTKGTFNKECIFDKSNKIDEEPEFDIPKEQ